MPTDDFQYALKSDLCRSQSEEVIRFFERVAQEEHWQHGGELRWHVSRSVYFGLWAVPKVPTAELSYLTGGLQLVRPDDNGTLPCCRVWPETTVLEKGSAHIAVLAVDEKWRAKSGGLFWLLTAEMWRYCVLNDIKELWLEATPRTMRCYQRIGWPLQIRGDLREHWGEPCYLCSLAVREVAGILAERAVRSQSYRRILANMVGDHIQARSVVSA